MIITDIYKTVNVPFIYIYICIYLNSFKEFNFKYDGINKLYFYLNDQVNLDLVRIKHLIITDTLGSVLSICIKPKEVATV